MLVLLFWLWRGMLMKWLLSVWFLLFWRWNIFFSLVMFNIISVFMIYLTSRYDSVCIFNLNTLLLILKNQNAGTTQQVVKEYAECARGRNLKTPGPALSLIWGWQGLQAELMARLQTSLGDGIFPLSLLWLRFVCLFSPPLCCWAEGVTTLNYLPFPRGGKNQLKKRERG